VVWMSSLPCWPLFVWLLVLGSIWLNMSCRRHAFGGGGSSFIPHVSGNLWLLFACCFLPFVLALSSWALHSRSHRGLCVYRRACSFSRGGGVHGLLIYSKTISDMWLMWGIDWNHSMDRCNLWGPSFLLFSPLNISIGHDHILAIETQELLRKKERLQKK
jgi:hypothetical protein